MKQRYRLFRRRGGVFYTYDNLTGKQASLGTRCKKEALRLLSAKNESHQQPALNFHIARAYLMGSDSAFAKRTWQHVMEAMAKTKKGPTLERWRRAVKEPAFDPIRNILIIDTKAEQLVGVLESGTISTNIFLRRMHNYALAMSWLPCPIIPKPHWPAIQFKEKRAITFQEHLMIISREKNPERKAFYQLCWHLGGSQSDIAHLKAKDIDWASQTVSYRRKKTNVTALIHFGEEAAKVIRSLPEVGPLFPYLIKVRPGDRATEFKQRCLGLGIKGVTLHSYRYSWAERAKTVGMPERFAQEALGHNSKAVHRAYARKALVQVPSLEEFEAEGESRSY